MLANKRQTKGAHTHTSMAVSFKMGWTNRNADGVQDARNRIASGGPENHKHIHKPSSCTYTHTPLLPQGHNALSRIRSVGGKVQAHYLFIFSLDGSSMVLYRSETAFLLGSDDSNFSQMKLLRLLILQFDWSSFDGGFVLKII